MNVHIIGQLQKEFDFGVRLFPEMFFRQKKVGRSVHELCRLDHVHDSIGEPGGLDCGECAVYEQSTSSAEFTGGIDSDDPEEKD